MSTKCCVNSAYIKNWRGGGDKDKEREPSAKKLMENEISTQFFIKKTNL